MAISGALAARQLSLSAGRMPLIQGLTLTFYPGEFIGVLGPSGCGKSTLLRLLAGLQKPSSGRVLLGQVSLDQATPEELRQIGFVPQDDVVHGSLKVESALHYSARLLGLSGETLKARVETVLNQLELSPRRRVRIDRLSGGQRKRVSIAVELLGDPKVLFLDEPTAGLDPALEDSFMHSCRGLCGSGCTLLMSTHVMQSLDQLDLVVILQQGHLVFLGPPAQAAPYFGVHSLPDIYRQLSSTAATPATAAAVRFQSSPFYGQYVEGRSR